MTIEKPLTYLISDGTITLENYSAKSAILLELIESAVDAGVSMIQIREKNLTIKLLFQLTSEAVKITQNSKTKIFINDRVDIALSANADGVHLTSNSISTNIFRRAFPSLLIGVSTHSLEKIFQAKNEGANFAVYSPIFFTPDKGDAKGIDELSRVVAEFEDFPVLALGGINELNIFEVLKTGCSGIAGIRLFNDLKSLSKIMKIINGEKDE